MKVTTSLPETVPATALPSLASAAELVSVPSLPATVVQSAWQRRWLNTRLRSKELSVLSDCMRQPARIIRTAKRARAIRKLFFGDLGLRKIARVAGRYYWGHHCPGWPSAAFDSYLRNEIGRIEPYREQAPGLHSVYMAITKKCPLACEHCFEWDNLNKKEKLSLADIRKMVYRFQAEGVAQIHFSGGEPMLRVGDLEEVIRGAQPGTDFWVITSGFHFTAENALRLKRAGLTGVSVSLDHYLPQAHNRFRGSERAFADAIQAVIHAKAAGLVVNLSLCTTKEFTTAENLMQYARLAKQLGVTFIQLLEPRAVGHYANRDVHLSSEQETLLFDFYEKLNGDPQYRGWPIVAFHGYHQRRVGCSGAGQRFLYVDTDGDVHACPFCQRKQGNVLAVPLKQIIETLQTSGCHTFKNAVF
jgi:MoaA/NifB/PqqE/SkfB family radical SAM enzyme